MRIIIPMAGQETRLRPHTLNTPRSLIHIAGKPIVQHLLEDLAALTEEEVIEIAFIVSEIRPSDEKTLLDIAESLGAQGKIYRQSQPLGSAHALLCAADSMQGKTIVAFSGQLFQSEMPVPFIEDALVWVNKSNSPEIHDSLLINEMGLVDKFLNNNSDENEQEKDWAMIGVYYFKEGNVLLNALNHVVENEVTRAGEFQMVDALIHLKEKGMNFLPVKTDSWLNCSTVEDILKANKTYLPFVKKGELISDLAYVRSSVIINPVFIGEGAKITDSVVGPYVSVGKNTTIEQSILKNSLIQNNAKLKSAITENSMIGANTSYEGKASQLNIGDFNIIKS